MSAAIRDPFSSSSTFLFLHLLWLENGEIGFYLLSDFLLKILHQIEGLG